MFLPKQIIFSLKANHPKLFQDVDTWFQAARPAALLYRLNRDTPLKRDRTEIRTIWTLPLMGLTIKLGGSDGD